MQASTVLSCCVEPEAEMDDWPLLARNDHAAASVFRPENMLREARRQKGLVEADVPHVCLLDPDGDIVHLLRTARGISLHPFPHRRRGAPVKLLQPQIPVANRLLDRSEGEVTSSKYDAIGGCRPKRRRTAGGRAIS